MVDLEQVLGWHWQQGCMLPVRGWGGRGYDRLLAPVGLIDRALGLDNARVSEGTRNGMARVLQQPNIDFGCKYLEF